MRGYKRCFGCDEVKFKDKYFSFDNDPLCKLCFNEKVKDGRQKRCFDCSRIKEIGDYYNFETDIICIDCRNKPLAKTAVTACYKKCTKCKETKNLSEYYGKDNKKMGWCKKCSIRQVMESRKRNPEKYKNYIHATISEPSLIYSRKKANAKANHINFFIPKEEFIGWYKKQELKCHYCYIRPEYFHLSNDRLISKKINLGLDRKNNNKGYNLKNIVLCCNRCNYIKGRFFSYEEMKIIGEVIVRGKWKERGVEGL